MDAYEEIQEKGADQSSRNDQNKHAEPDPEQYHLNWKYQYHLLEIADKIELMKSPNMYAFFWLRVLFKFK